MTTLKQLIINLIGSYEPVVTTLEDGSEVVQYDITYIAAAFIFVIAIFCVFKVIGGLICSNR